MQVKRMETILRPVQKVPALVKEQRDKHPKVYFWVVFGLIVFLCFSVLHFFTIKRTETLTVQNEQLSLDIQNLKMFQDQRVRILRLEQVLLSNENIKQKLGADNIAPFAFKILTLEDQYKDDGITASLLLGLIEVESAFTPKAVSETGAYGLMQILRSTSTPYLRNMGREWSEVTMFDPIINVQVGVAVLVDLHRMYMTRGLEKKDEFTFSLSAYNMGEGTVQAAVNKKDKVYLNYVVKVKLAAKNWAALGV